MIFTKLFWIDATERAVATAAQVFLSVIGADTLNILSTNWRAALVVAVGGALLSYVKSFAATQTGNKQSASLANIGTHYVHRDF